ncbi:hypothetical protein H5410_036497 [Solanum commersonii]|uniref:Uncharacterized protein n=1 Tax=Solanum commersonii TaxID=4109 RepID=A0A9J5Y4E2_SOLCO|nr:hypothetical protein H5410_036497 [Solanum commersonii]
MKGPWGRVNCSNLRYRRVSSTSECLPSGSSMDRRAGVTEDPWAGTEFVVGGVATEGVLVVVGRRVAELLWRAKSGSPMRLAKQ